MICCGGGAVLGVLCFLCTEAGAYNAWTFFDFSEFFLPYVELIPGSDFSATISKILARTLFFEKRPGSGRDVLCAQKRPG